MPSISDQAIVLKRIEYSETSQVLVLLTHGHGKVRVIAKGVKRSTKTRFAVGVDLLEVGAVQFLQRHGAGQELATLTDWQQIRTYLGLRRSLDRLYAAEYAAEIVAALTADADPDPELYCDFLDLLDALNGEGETLVRLCTFILGLMTRIGMAPDWNQCVGCRRTVPVTARTVYFSSFEGGLLCRDCEPSRVEKRSVPPAALAFLRDPSVPSSAGCRAAFAILDYHLGHLMGRPPALGAMLLSSIPAKLARGSV